MIVADTNLIGAEDTGLSSDALTVTFFFGMALFFYFVLRHRRDRT